VKLVDVMSASGLSIYAIVALVLFMISFVAIVIRTFAPSQASQQAYDARLPLSDDDQAPAQSGRGVTRG
jgi:cbb3-type cytochrome oxidase subunit 3